MNAVIFLMRRRDFRGVTFGRSASVGFNRLFKTLFERIKGLNFQGDYEKFHSAFYLKIIY